MYFTVELQLWLKSSRLSVKTSASTSTRRTSDSVCVCIWYMHLLVSYNKMFLSVGVSSFTPTGTMCIDVPSDDQSQ